MAQDQTRQIKLIVIGGSSGSLEVIMKILPALKRGFSIPILLVLHRNSSSDSALTELLASISHLSVKEMDDKEQLLPGNIYIAPPDYHALVEPDGMLSLDVSERVHFCRPSIDVSLSSAAQAYADGVVAIILSGANSDGAAGIQQVHEAGGFTIAQDPGEAAVSYMPEQAISTNAVDRVLSTKEMVEYLNGLGN